MNKLKFEYLRFDDTTPFTPLDDVTRQAFEQSVNILYEDHVAYINSAKGSIVSYLDNDGRLYDRFMLENFPPGVPNYQETISEIIKYMA